LSSELPKKATLGFSLPSLQVLLMGVVFGQAANELVAEVPKFLQATEASQSSFAVPVAINAALLAWATTELGKSFGVLGKVRAIAPTSLCLSNSGY
jgi:hypothetical protein